MLSAYGQHPPYRPIAGAIQLKTKWECMTQSTFGTSIDRGRKLNLYWSVISRRDDGNGKDGAGHYFTLSDYEWPYSVVTIHSPQSARKMLESGTHRLRRVIYDPM